MPNTSVTLQLAMGNGKKVDKY